MMGNNTELYNFVAAQKSCPIGWHLPIHDEWKELENFQANSGHNFDGSIDGEGSKIAKSLSSTSEWYSDTSNIFYREKGDIQTSPSTNNSSSFCVYIFIIGIFSTYLFQNITPEHFGNPLNAFYSIEVILDLS